MNNPLRRISRHIFILLLALPLPAWASCALCTCTVNATGVSFGTYSPLSGLNAENTGSVRLSCGGGGGTVGYTIRLSRGMYSAGFSPRCMSNGRGRLNYELYIDPAHTTIWGDGSSATAFISDSLGVRPAGSSRNHVVYGRIPARQTSAAVGSYSDTITITIIYQ